MLLLSLSCLSEQRDDRSQHKEIEKSRRLLIALQSKFHIAPYKGYSQTFVTKIQATMKFMKLSPIVRVSSLRKS